MTYFSACNSTDVTRYESIFFFKYTRFRKSSNDLCSGRVPLQTRHDDKRFEKYSNNLLRCALTHEYLPLVDVVCQECESESYETAEGGEDLL